MSLEQQINFPKSFYMIFNRRNRLKPKLTCNFTGPPSCRYVRCCRNTSSRAACASFTQQQKQSEGHHGHPGETMNNGLSSLSSKSSNDRPTFQDFQHESLDDSVFAFGPPPLPRREPPVAAAFAIHGHVDFDANSEVEWYRRFCLPAQFKLLATTMQTLGASVNVGLPGPIFRRRDFSVKNQ